MTESSQYFEELGRALGLDIVPDDEGRCFVSVEGDLPVELRADDDHGRMVVTAVVAPELPEETSYSDMLDILDTAAGPLFDAPGIGRDPESGAIVMYLLSPFASCNAAEFAEAFPRFQDLARLVSAKLCK